MRIPKTADRRGGEASFRGRALRLVCALAVFSVGPTACDDGDGGGFYAMPPALPSLGYKSLSSNSYAFKACALLYQATGEPEYLEMARSVIDFLLDDLYKGGVVYHHVFEGTACTGDIWCPGCNFRILQYMDYLDDLERNGPDATKDRP